MDFGAEPYLELERHIGDCNDEVVHGSKRKFRVDLSPIIEQTGGFYHAGCLNCDYCGQGRQGYMVYCTNWSCAASEECCSCANVEVGLKRHGALSHTHVTHVNIFCCEGASTGMWMRTVYGAVAAL